MAVRPILLFPNPHLSRPCHTVKHFGDSFQTLVKDLLDTMYRSPGVGLAAPQIGIHERVSVIDTSRVKKSKDKNPPASSGLIILVNPVLLRGEGVQIPREGCLSVPDLLGNVRRYKEVSVRYQTETGEERFLTSSDFEALALQHEIDHLDGKLFLDRISNLKTDIFRRKNQSES